MKNKFNYLLFTGHMIDRPGRKNPRFPLTLEPKVREAIRQEVQKEKENYPVIRGIAGGACGGDILFHEVCTELNLATELYLALPREKFIAGSVAFAGPQWVHRFDTLYKKLPKHIQYKNTQEGFWESNNLWMLENALIYGAPKMSVIALWDKLEGDGEGGTAHMIREAIKRGVRVIVIDINML